jgi:hypothetical protein
MAEIGVEIRGLDELRREIERLITDMPEILEPGVERALSLLYGRLRQYPPPRGNYQRTFRLQDSWSAETVLSGDVLGFVRSDSAVAPHNRYVQSRASQAWMHRGRWQTVEDVAEKERQAVIDILASALAAHLARV